jgi:protein-tyrosine phosphatase
VYIDIHTHILPEIDDGAQDIDEAVAMLRIAHGGGTRKIVLTSHMFIDLFDSFDFVEIRDRFSQFLFLLKSREEQFNFLRELDLYLGAENYASPEFLEALDQGRVLSLNGSRYLMVEFSPMLFFDQIAEIIQRVLLAGYTPIIAHPERYAAIQEDPLRIERLWQMGCVVQINADSLLRDSISRTNKCAHWLLREGFVDVIASDAHRPGWRPPCLDLVFECLEQQYAREDIAQWMWSNANLILANKSLVCADSADVQDQTAN